MKIVLLASVLLASIATTAIAANPLVTPSPVVKAQLTQCGFVLPAGVMVKESSAKKIAAFSALKSKAVCGDKASFLKSDEKFRDALWFTVEGNTVHIMTGHQPR